MAGFTSPVLLGLGCGVCAGESGAIASLDGVLTTVEVGMLIGVLIGVDGGDSFGPCP